MKNRFFQEMQRIGIKYRKGKLTPENFENSRFNHYPPFSQGQSFAYKFWAISERYHATDIIVDELPKQEEISLMLTTFIEAGIDSIVVTNDDILRSLSSFGCEIIRDVKVYRRETELYYGSLEIIKGIRLKINV